MASFTSQPKAVLGLPQAVRIRKGIILPSLLIVNTITYIVVTYFTQTPTFSLLNVSLLAAARLQPGRYTTKGMYSIHDTVYNSADESPRCRKANICDGQHLQGSCGKDELGCVTSAATRQRAVRQAMKHSWRAYREHAWGHDELHIKADGSLSYRDWQHQGITIIDAMSTLLLMNMTEEYQVARDWAVQPEHFKRLGSASVFETNIRVVGGLLSAYTLNGTTDSALLSKAQQVADSLLPSFEAPGGVPHSFYTSGTVHQPHKHLVCVTPCALQNLAEAGTYSLEMTTLSQLAGNPIYANVSNRFWNQLRNLRSCDGLYCTWFNPSTMQCRDHAYGFGASADSMYEYMLKQWILSHKQDQSMLGLYTSAMAGLRQHLVTMIKPCKGVTGSKDTDSARQHTQVRPTSAPHIGGRTSSAAGAATQARSLLRDSIIWSKAASQSYWHDSFWIVGEGVQTGCCSNQKSGAGCGGSRSPAQQQGTALSSRSMHSRQQEGHSKLHLDTFLQGFTRHTLQTGLQNNGVAQTPAVIHGSNHSTDRHSDPQNTAAPAVKVQMRLQHLTCFLPGLLALGHMHGVNTASQNPGMPTSGHSLGHPTQAETVDDLLLAAKLMRGCYELYRNSETGVAGDAVHWHEAEEAGDTCHKLSYTSTDSFLRPEVIESLFYLWRATHDQVYRDWGWQIFRSHYEHSRLPSGAYATLKVRQSWGVKPAEPGLSCCALSEQRATTRQYCRGDRQESFWLAETLKYLYLLFSDDPALLPLDAWVLNTEAHPLRVWNT